MIIKIFKSIARKIRWIWRFWKFIIEYLEFKNQIDEERLSLSWGDRYLCLDDKTKNTGFDRHYLYHPAWAARILAETKPALHIDISSTLSFATMLSAFMPVHFYDYRPADVELSNLKSEAGNLVNLPFLDSSVVSLSCMHVVEHIGLGRYGDPIDPNGDLKAMKELKRVLAVGGNFLFVVPVGKPRVMFNAHRVYSYNQVVEYFFGLNLVSFALISERQDDGGLNFDATPGDVASQNYGCGCFWFRKDVN